MLRRKISNGGERALADHLAPFIPHLLLFPFRLVRPAFVVLDDEDMLFDRHQWSGWFLKQNRRFRKDLRRHVIWPVGSVITNGTVAVKIQAGGNFPFDVEDCDGALALLEFHEPRLHAAR